MRLLIAIALLIHSSCTESTGERVSAGAIIRAVDAAECPLTCQDASLPALTHSCPALPCLSIFNCTAPDGILRCKCELPVGTPHYIADCFGP